jgi:hypothetical protein
VSSVQRGKGAGGLSLQAEKRERAGGAALTLEKTRWVVAGRELAMTMVAGMGALSVPGATDRWALPLFNFHDFAKPNQCLNSKLVIEVFPASKNHEKIWAARVDQGEKLSFLVKHQNRNGFGITNLEVF